VKQLVIMAKKPVAGAVNIRIKGHQKSNLGFIDIIDVYGRKVKTYKWSGQTIQWDTDQTDEGMYFVRYIENGQIVCVKKLVVM